ncbi:uncharacterized protein [Euphorbia lathyris]|uniref:uncharacterized protein n=1 Tax=Euphorbia lathyris TaxID=212925 RepID=UPI0033137150
MKLSSLVCATLDFDYPPEDFDDPTKQVLEQILQLKHIKELNIRNRYIKTLSDLGVEVLSSPPLNCECLTLDATHFDEHLLGIVCAIHSSPMLEKLVINLRLFQCEMSADVPDLNDWREKNYWNSDGTVFNCCMSQLKIIKIVIFSDGFSQCKHLLEFVEFLLNNATELELMGLALRDGGIKDGGTDLADQISQKLLSIPNSWKVYNW